MLIKTDSPVIIHRDHITQQIARFWDQISGGWQTIWGQHIHHGYYENELALTKEEAQVKLIEKLASLLTISPQSEILDAGCGLGGSSLYLAKTYDARVTGITLSKEQVRLATAQAQKEHIHQVTFTVADALALSPFADNSFDIVWSLESCEQFYDKALFFKQAHRVLKPGGKFMLATWCSDSDVYEGKLAKNYRKLCLAFDLPYMPTIAYYRQLFHTQGFDLHHAMDWSCFVKKSWDIGVSLVNTYSLLQLLRLGGWRGLRFAKQIKLMQKAFQQKHVQYGVLIGSKRTYSGI